VNRETEHSTSAPAAASGATADKSRSSAEPWQARFNAALAEWRKTCCQYKADADAAPCGAPPHRVKMVSDEKNPGGQIMLVDCARDHKEQWAFAVTAQEMEASLADAEKAAGRARAATEEAEGRDPNKARLLITMDMKTQEVTIEPWVPTPGLGVQLAGHALAYFFSQLNALPTRPADGIHLATKKEIVHPTTGRVLKGK
jgi:hypothetical protein